MNKQQMEEFNNGIKNIISEAVEDLFTTPKFMDECRSRGLSTKDTMETALIISMNMILDQAKEDMAAGKLDENALGTTVQACLAGCLDKAEAYGFTMEEMLEPIMEALRAGGIGCQVATMDEQGNIVPVDGPLGSSTNFEGVPCECGRNHSVDELLDQIHQHMRTEMDCKDLDETVATLGLLAVAKIRSVCEPQGTLEAALNDFRKSYTHFVAERFGVEMPADKTEALIATVMSDGNFQDKFGKQPGTEVEQEPMPAPRIPSNRRVVTQQKATGNKYYDKYRTR